ncbi:NAD(+) synthase [Spiroplasma endosymbiont of Crioceris asparagi]|uniref:NAD(+) synthase n=1 Tax=Spiroplasma endosymbiont of Crioceris asparagi TaxID=3066286 RepID=UPI0030CB0AF0
MEKNLEKYLDYLVEWIKEEVHKAKADGVIVGISGGIDSAVVSLLAKKAFPNNYLTVWMPCNSSQMDYDCVEELINNNQLVNVTVDLGTTYKELELNLIKTKVNLDKLALANSRARLRMTTLYALGQSKKYLVLGTDNLDEWHIGYFTKFGDGGVDLLPISGLLKREVKKAGEILGVPKSIIERKPTAGLWENQTDESEIGFSYDVIDDYLDNKEVVKEAKIRIEQLHNVSEHKRIGAPKPKRFKE